MATSVRLYSACKVSCLKIFSRNVKGYCARTSQTERERPGIVNFWLVERRSSSKLIGYLLLSPVSGENRMWKFQRKKRNSTQTSGKHLCVICVTEGGGKASHSNVRTSELERVRGMTGIGPDE